MFSCTPSYFANDVPERPSKDHVAEMDIICMKEKIMIVTHAKVRRAEDMDSSARASCSDVQIQEDSRAPETNKFKSSMSVSTEHVPDETLQESVVAQNEGIINVVKYVNKQNQEAEKSCTNATEVPEKPLTREVNEALAPFQFMSHANQADEQTFEKMELPGTTKSYQDSRKPTPIADVELISTRSQDLSVSIEQESGTELELKSGDVQNCLIISPVEEKGIASFLDSCQEALALDVGVIDTARVEGQGEMSPAGADTKHNIMRLRNKGGQECSVS